MQIVESRKMSWDLWIAAARVDREARKIGILDKDGNVTADGWRAWYNYLGVTPAGRRAK